jgi:hypothetical protein
VVGGENAEYCELYSHTHYSKTYKTILFCYLDANIQEEKGSLSLVPPGPLPFIPRPLHDMQNYIHFAEINYNFYQPFLRTKTRHGEVNIFAFVLFLLLMNLIL